MSAKDEIERADRDMMSGVIGGAEWRQRMRDIARDECTACLGSGLLRDGYDDAPPLHVDRLRWVACEACGGSGEIIRGRDGDDYNEPCAVCEGTGRDCVEVSPVECNDDLDD